MKAPPEIIDEIKARLSTADAAHRLGLRVNGKWRCPDPSHSKGGALSIQDHGGYRCFACGATGGDAIALIQWVDGREFRDALEVAASFAGVTLPESSSMSEVERERLKRAAAQRQLEREAEATQRRDVEATATELRARVHDELAQEFESADLGDDVHAALRARALHPQTAHDCGVRSLAGVDAWLHDKTDVERFAAGWSKRNDDGDSFSPSGAAYAVRNPSAGACLFPTWRRVDGKWHREWRVRRWNATGSQRKSTGLRRNDSARGPELIGVHLPPRCYPATADRLAGVDCDTPQRFTEPARARVVFVCEGESDYLSAMSWIQARGHRDDVAAVGVCGTPHKAETEALAELLCDVERVVVAIDRDTTTQGGELLIAEQLTLALMLANDRRRVLEVPLAPGDDLNTLAQRDELHTKLDLMMRLIS